MKTGSKKIGCFVCNYNKKNYVLDCVESLLTQSYQYMDVYVVDNLSTDGSVEALKERFGSSLNVHVNKENKGGSGGFAQGISIALENNYEYAVLVDNDVKVDKYAIEKMSAFLDDNNDVGIVGAKILQMSFPDRIQDMGGSITSDYRMLGNYWGYLDKNIPDVLDSDYVSTCMAMIRMSALRVFGSMPEENFIYWDDVELSKKCQLSGYRTVALGSAKVWHKMQTANESPFNRYYLTRNRFKFFSIYASDDEIEKFKEISFEDIYSRNFMYRYKGLDGIAQTYINALEDFIEGIYGRAREGRLVEQEDVKPMLTIALADRKKVSILSDLCVPEQRYVVEQIKGLLGEKAIVHVGRKFIEDDSFTRIQVCNHVKEVKSNMLPVIMVDRFMHCIATQEQFEIISNYETEFENFKNRFWEKFSDAVDKLRIRGMV